MNIDTDLEKVKELFAASISRSLDERPAIKDPSAALPSTYLVMDVPTVALWMLSVLGNAATEEVKTQEKKAAKKREDDRSRLLPQRFDHIHRKELHTLMVEAGGNALILNDYTLVHKLESFLREQANFRAAAARQPQMSNAR